MMQPSSLLVVDPDPRGLETLTFGFEREGYAVSGTPDLRRAELLARTTSPALAIVAIRDGQSSAMEAVSGLREVARELPVLVVGPLAARAEALTAGATDFLTLPVFLRDVISVGRLSVHASEAARRGSAKDAEIQMRLSEHYGLFYLLRAMSASSRSGLLQLARGNRRAELRVHEGTVVSVSVGAMQGLPALHHLLLWEESAVSLIARSVPKRSQLHLSAQEMLDESERFLRDFAHAARELGPPRTIYVPAVNAPVEVRGLQPSQMAPLLRLFDGRRGLSDVIEESPFRIFDTVRMIRRLREANVLVTRAEGPRERPPTGPMPTLHAGPNGAPRSMLEQWAMVPDQRGIVGDRRSTSRRLRPLATPAPAPAPIQLTAKKSSGAFASGEIPVAARRPTPAAATARSLAVAPSVQVALDSLPPPVLSPVAPIETPPPRARGGSGRHAPLDSEAPAPRARPGSGRHAALDEVAARSRPESGRHAPLESPSRPEPTPRPRRTTGQPPQTAEADAFDAIESDFFAREADLYRREAVETFDDLDREAGASPGSRKKR
jgi:DNA-binding response OmpR family regulator